MVPEKKPIDSKEESVVTPEDEALEQTAVSEQTDVFPEDFAADVENSTVLTRNNGMVTGKKSLSVGVRRFRTVIAMVVAVLIIVGGIVGIQFIPEDTTDSSTASTSISVKKVETANIEKIEVNTAGEQMVFKSKLSTTNDDASSSLSSSYTWVLDGYDANLIASSSINAAADSIATLYATRIMEQNQNEKALYGLDKPSITVNVTMREGDDYTLMFGDMAPDGSGYYATVTGDEKIYLISAGTVGNFNTTVEALADTVILTAPTIEDIVKKTDKKYFDEESGALATFDSIVLSGPKYGQKVSITPIENNDFVQYSIDLGSYSRYADPDVVEEMFSLMTNGLVAIDTYALEPTDAEIKKYGLDSPELYITINYGSLSTNLKAKMYDTENQYYAVMVDDRDAIYAVTADALAMLEYGVTDYYYQFVFQEYIYDFKNMTVETPDKTYSFNIKHDTSNDTFTATSGGKTVDDSLLSAYYQYFLTLSPEIKDSYTDGEPTLKATFTYKGTTKGERVIELIKQTERRYLLRIDGNDLGIVKSTDLDHLIVYAEYVMTDKGIPEP